MYEKLSLECQPSLVQIKYNFIHYNPLPPIRETDKVNDIDD